MSYEAHEISALIPFVIDQTLYEIRDSIQAHGQLSPAIIYEGKILDGRLRQWCCDQLGIPLKTEEFKGSREEALDLFISLNVIRQHLTLEEKAVVAAKIAELERRNYQITSSDAESQEPDETF